MKICLLLPCLILFVSCSTINKVGIRATGGILSKAGNEFTRESDLKFFENSVPGNLKFIEGLWYNDQSNTTLLTSLIKGFGGYGFAISETHYLNEKYSGKDNGPRRIEAITFYSKAMDYGVHFLEANGIEWKDMLANTAADNVGEMFNNKLDDDDMQAVFYLAQSWGGLINLQRDRVELISKLPTVKAMMDWVCKKDPEFESGSCHLFYAAYEAGRPSMLGGNPENGRAMFEKFIKDYPQNLMARVAFLEFYVIPMMEEDVFAAQMSELGKELALWEKQKNYADDMDRTSKYRKFEKYNLYNAIAKERFNIIKKNQKELF